MSWEVWPKATILVWKVHTLLISFREVRFHKDETSHMLTFFDHIKMKYEPNRIQLVVGGEKLIYEEDTGSPTASI